MLKFIVVNGDLSSGFSFYGLFDSADDANSWINRHNDVCEHENMTWWIVKTIEIVTETE